MEKKQKKKINSETKKTRNINIGSVKLKLRSSSKFSENRISENKYFSKNKFPIKQKKKILIPLFKLNKQPPKDINKMNIEELKSFASEFDLNPKINYKILEYLKRNSSTEFKRYIEKYKYTLDFEDALKLGCFEIKKVKLILEEFNQNFKNNRVCSVNEIKSLSKLKIFNFFCYILKLCFNFKLATTEIEICRKNILEYANSQTLIFKVPNRFGNLELKYYVYLTFIINYLISDIKNDTTNNNIIENDISDFTSSSEEQVYFNWNNKSTGTTKYVDLTDFFDRKKELENFFNINNFNNSINNKNITFNKVKKDSNQWDKFLNKIARFSYFQEVIMEMINEPDEIILDKIKFFYYGLIFISQNSLFLIYSRCFKQYKSYEIEMGKGITKTKKKSHFAYSNIDNKYSDSIKNPFSSNSFYYDFPTFLKKNFLQNDKKLYEDYKNFIKYIYSSEIMKDIFYLCPEFNEFAYPLDDDEIFNEIFDYTLFVPFNTEVLHGFTQKEIPEIIIPVNLENPKETDLSKIICQLTQILNTTIHEQTKHYLKSLIFYNSFRFNIKKRINSNLYDHGEETKYIQAILQKTKTNNNINNVKIDGGNKAEIFLYGKILDKIYFYQAIELFKYSNWEMTITEHIQTFQNKNTLVNSLVSFDTIKKNKDLSDFIKTFIVKFEKSFNKDKKTSEIYIMFEPNASACRESKNDDISIDPNIIKFDTNAFITLPENNIHDASW